ncbi:MAG: M14 family metallopeptidase [Bacteroidales bacterium]|nr:M14 family metallopeptidase [Bacteroidales bacterium]
MMLYFKKLVFIILGLSLIQSVTAQQLNWLTFYEQSGQTETPRYSETMSFVKQLDDFSNKIHTNVFGISPQGRDLVYLVYDKDGLNDSQAIRDAGRIVLFVQACIHPGESEGKDAMLMLLRDLVVHKQHANFFQNVSLLFIPIFNADGHERFSPYGRINQNGPKEMGWRTTAQNLNLNRDHLKADAPEMQAWLRFYHQWQPEFFIDTHTSNGADYQYVITYALETGGLMNQKLTDWQTDIYLPELEKTMENAGFPIFPYVSFRRWHDPRSGLISGVASPIFSQGYTGVRNRPGLLVETHMLKPYHLRVESTKEIILATLKILDKQHGSLRNLILEADDFAGSKAFRSQPYPLRFNVDMTDSAMLPFKGFEYEILKSELTSGDWFVYDNTKPVDFLLPMFDKSKAAVSVSLPEAYIIPVEWQDVIYRLQLHGIEMFPTNSDAEIETETYHFTKVEWSRTPYEGRHRVSQIQFDGETSVQLYSKGSMVIPMNQPLAPLVAYLLEPQANGSLLEWGFFNIIFEQKEYAETYVMEPLSRAMLDSVQGLREEYEAKKLSEPAFIGNQRQQLNWFYSKTPWWDQQYMRYPVGRILDETKVPEGSTRRTR